MPNESVEIRLGLAGYPLGHSFSPLLHQAALEDAGLVGSYRLFPIPPLPDGRERLVELLERLHTGELDGLNVTIPHKQSIVGLVDECSATVRRIGAANVIYRREGRLVAENTDAGAFHFHLKSWLSTPENGCACPKKALVLGAGGAARAVVDALLTDGWEVSVAARREAQAEELCSRFGGFYPASCIEPGSLSVDFLAGRQPKLIVNTTPLGMQPSIATCPWPETLPLPAGTAVYDLVYNPPETVLLKRARAAALPAINGSPMLVEQAARAFQLWTGLPSPARVMYEAIQKELGGQRSTQVAIKRFGSGRKAE